MNIRIEKRFPFGFKGLWGQCYKLTNYNQTKNTIIYQRSTYYDVGYDVQLKYLEDGVDKSVINAQPVQNLVTKGEFRLVKTTDAYFDGIKYECIVQPNDIVHFDGEYWLCEKVDERSIFNPAKQTVYYLSMKKIFDKVILGEN